MVPVSWAMAKVLKYEPSDPIHYMAYQLLHWKNDNVIQTKKDTIYKVIASATVTMDHKFSLRRLLEKEKLVKSLNEKSMENIPCTICKDYQELHCIKQRCWKCIKRPARKYKTCEFPQMCSSCKINEVDKSMSRKHEICEFPQMCSSCKINEVDKSMSRKHEICEFPQMCSTCKINMLDKNDKCISLPHLERLLKQCDGVVTTQN
ncbi:uncharacterized protein LOC143154783 [Ptiloglossa arizonensis]|uniref:uncharacterized protein LOC143154783 n=1 Tax=Ptiloglossa arizonensis TaxID=3350558 RepID=UPI003FA1733E